MMELLGVGFGLSPIKWKLYFYLISSENIFNEYDTMKRWKEETSEI